MVAAGLNHRLLLDLDLQNLMLELIHRLLPQVMGKLLLFLNGFRVVRYGYQQIEVVLGIQLIRDKTTTPM